MPAFNRRQTLQLMASMGGLPLIFSAAMANTAKRFPSKPMRIFNPFPVGGGPDGVSRLIASKLADAYQQPVLVENRPGANGFLAIEAFRQGARDGHDLMVLDLVHLTAYRWLFKHLPYDPQRDFTPLLPTFRTHFFIVVGKDSPHQHLSELLAAARQPGAVTYGSWAVGSPAHLGGAMLAAQTRTDMRHIVYKETAQLYTDVANGTLSFALGTLATTRSLLDGGRLRLLAVAAPKRLPTHPNVPTVAQAGGPANFEMAGINLMVAPPGLPAQRADQLWRDVGQALQGPDVDAKFTAFGYEHFSLPRAAMPRYLAEQAVFQQQLVKAADITPM
jgi:tripartite-type tricarboxylate transporter receptor subunit TctC